MIVHGSDAGFYDLKGDCESCKSRCLNNSRCAGVECGRKDNKCVWWKPGECGTLMKQSREDSSYKTCMKYDDGKINSSRNNIRYSSQNYFINCLIDFQFNFF